MVEFIHSQLFNDPEELGYGIDDDMDDWLKTKQVEKLKILRNITSKFRNALKYVKDYEDLYDKKDKAIICSIAQEFADILAFRYRKEKEQFERDQLDDYILHHPKKDFEED